MSEPAPLGALEILLEQDGVTLPGEGGSQKEVDCFSDHHDDSEKQMLVNVTKGTYFCSGCQIKGDAYSYLADIRGVTEADASHVLSEMGWTAERVELSKDRRQASNDRKAGLPKHFAKPFPMLDSKHKAVCNHDYLLEEGKEKKLFCRVVRYANGETRPFTPSSRGGWWFCRPTNKALPPDERVEKGILYRLPELMRMKQSRQIWVVVNERTVDAVLTMKHPPKDGPPPCTCIMPGTRNIEKFDTVPLYGEKVLLIANQDQSSVLFMKALGRHLVRHGSAVRYCLPSGAGGYGIADATAEGGWPKTKEWMQKIGITTHDPKPDVNVLSIPMADTPHFKVFGVFGDSVVAQLKNTFQVITLRMQSLVNAGTLLRLAPLHFWLENCDKEAFSATNRVVLADAIIQAASKLGIFDPDERTIGRGAVKLGDRIGFNVGDKVLLEGESSGVLDEAVGFDNVEGVIMAPGPRIEVVDDLSAPAWAHDLYQSVMSYRWNSEDDGRAFCGWLVTSLVGGALPFRPMLWLSAPASTGKTFLLEQVLQRFFGHLVSPIGDVTEAGLAAKMGHDSRPAYIDEFEPRSGGPVSEARWKDVLSLLRLSTSGESERVRASGGTDSSGIRAVKATPRFSVLLSSIERPYLSEANRSRFFMARLSRKGVEDWPSVEAAITRATDTGRATAIRSYIIRNTPSIVRKSRTIQDSFVPGLSTRKLHLLSALTSGAGFLSGDYSPIYDGEEQGEDEGERVDADMLKPLLSMLSSHIQHGGLRLTIMECLIRTTYGRLALDGNWYRHRSDKAFADISERYGFKPCLDNIGEEGVGVRLYVGHDNRALSSLLKQTEYESMDISNYLNNLPGAYRPRTKSRAKRVAMAGRQAPVTIIPSHILDLIGFFPPNAPANPATISVDKYDNMFDDDGKRAYDNE